jgi:hypothetical protein
VTVPADDLKFSMAYVSWVSLANTSSRPLEGDKVVFVTKVKERDAPALSHAAVTLVKSDVVKAKL